MRVAAPGAIAAGGRVRSALLGRRLPLVLALLAIVLTLPALWVGWQLDDHAQRLLMLGRAPAEFSGMEAFSVLRGDPDELAFFVESGILPWWTPEGFRMAFFRFLTLATTWLDYRLWPESAALMHLHSLTWLGALVAGAALLYRRILGSTWVAGLAALLYAVDDAHAAPAAWLANRNALVTTFFGVLCLLAHDRWRRGGWQPGALWGPVALALALASGEAALATAGYLAAHALFLDRGPARERILALAPHGLVVAAWAALYRLGGFGVRGSGLYFDPLTDPAGFGAALAERAPLLLLGQWTPLPAEIGFLLLGPAIPLAWWLGVAVTVGLAALVAPLLKRDAAARFWALGMALSLVPVAAAPPSNRLLFFVGLGGMGLLAQILAGRFEPAELAELAEPGEPAGARRGWPGRLLAAFLLATHLILAPLAMPVGAAAIRALGEPAVAAAATIPSDPEIADQTLVVVSAPDYLVFVSAIPTLKALAGEPSSPRLRALAAAPAPVEVRRLDARALAVRIEGGLHGGTLGRLFFDPDRPLLPGAEVRLSDFRARVAAADASGSPTEVVYTFDAPLEHPSLRWVAYRDGAFVPFAPPPIGQTVRLPAPIGPFDRFALAD